MLEQKIDTVVLGCTHYPFVIPVIKEIVGPEVRVIDPAPAVARQTERLLQKQGWKTSSLQLFTSGDKPALENLLPLLLGETALVKQVAWLEDRVLQIGKS